MILERITKNMLSAEGMRCLARGSGMSSSSPSVVGGSTPESNTYFHNTFPE